MHNHLAYKLICNKLYQYESVKFSKKSQTYFK